MAKKKGFLDLSLWIEGGMIFLALVSGYLLFLEFTAHLTDRQIQAFDTIDLIIAIVFLSEFALKLFISKKRRVFLKFHWWELLAAIPVTTPLTQTLRLLRLLRLLHLAQSVTN